MSQKYKQLGLVILMVNTQMILTNGNEKLDVSGRDNLVQVVKLSVSPVRDKYLLERLFGPRDLRDAAPRGISVVSGLSAWYGEPREVFVCSPAPVGEEDIGLDLGSPKPGA
jgi:hypothetical protein